MRPPIHGRLGPCRFRTAGCPTGTDPPPGDPGDPDDPGGGENCPTSPTTCTDPEPDPCDLDPSSCTPPGCAAECGDPDPDQLPPVPPWVPPVAAKVVERARPWWQAATQWLSRVGGLLKGLPRMPVENANKLNHLFGNPEHNLGPLLAAAGGPEKAYERIWRAAQPLVTQNGLFNQTVRVLGFNVTVQGNVIDDVLRIGTAFIRP